MTLITPVMNILNDEKPVGINTLIFNQIKAAHEDQEKYHVKGIQILIDGLKITVKILQQSVEYMNKPFDIMDEEMCVSDEMCVLSPQPEIQVRIILYSMPCLEVVEDRMFGMKSQV